MSVSLGWHYYKADISPITLPDYNRWLGNFDAEKYASFDMRHGAESEYDDCRTAAQQSNGDRKLRDDRNFLCTGKHIERDDLDKQDVTKWTVEAMEELLPFYEAYHGK